MNSNFARIIATAALAATAVVLAGCASMSSLPNDKLSEAAANVTGKPIKSVSNVRSVGDVQYFDAIGADGKVYDCSLSVVFGVSYQHQKCQPK